MREVRNAQKVYIYTGLSVICVFFVSALIWTGTQVYGSIYPTQEKHLSGEKACVHTAKDIEDISESKEDSERNYEMQSSPAKQEEKKTTEHELERNEMAPKSEEKTVCAPEEKHTNSFAAESEEEIEMEAECVQEKPQINTDIIPVQWESNVHNGPSDKKINMKTKVGKMLKTFKYNSLTTFLNSINKLGTDIQEKKEIIYYCSNPSFESPKISNINEFKENMKLLRQYIEKKMALDKKGFSSFDALQRQVCQIEMAQQANKRHSVDDIYVWLGQKKCMHAAAAVLSMFICIPAVYADMRKVSVEEIEQAYLPEKHTLSQNTLNGYCAVLKGVRWIVCMRKEKNDRRQITNDPNIELNSKYNEIKDVLKKMDCTSPQDIYLAVHTSFSMFYEHAPKHSTPRAGEGLFRSTSSHCIQLVHKKSNVADRTSIIFSTNYVADGHAAELPVRKASMHAAPGFKVNMDCHAHVYYVDNTMQTCTRVCLPLCKGEVFAKAYKICDAIKCLSIIFSKDTESIYVLSESKEKKGESRWAILNTEECNKVLVTAIETHNIVFYHIENKTPGNREDSDYTAVHLVSTHGKDAAGWNSKHCVSVPLFVTKPVRFAMNMLYSTCSEARNCSNIDPIRLNSGTVTLDRIKMPEKIHPYYSPLYLGKHAVDLAAPYTDCQSLCAGYEDGGNTISWYAPTRTGQLSYICARNNTYIQREDYNCQNSTYLVKAKTSNLFRLVFSPAHVDSEKILIVQNISNNASCVGIEQLITAAIMGKSISKRLAAV